jgi:hypothetical protein
MFGERSAFDKTSGIKTHRITPKISDEIRLRDFPCF